jgi:uncharacterized protein (TIGR02246 family)
VRHPGREVVREIATLRRRWIGAINMGSAVAFVSCVTDDAVWLPPRGDAVQGPEALRRWLQGLFEQYDYQFSTSEERIRLAGDRWAVEDARFHSVPRPKSGEGKAAIPRWPVHDALAKTGVR